MSKLGKKRKAWKVQRALVTELPGLGKPGALERRPYPPGQHGQARRKLNEYGLRLREKQKVLFHYNLREEQLRRFVKNAKKTRGGDWMSALIGLLETRIDNLVFRLGFAPSIAAARQLVTHGKVLVDGKRLSIPSAQVFPGSVISLTPETYDGPVYQYAVNKPRLLMPDWLVYTSENAQQRQGKLKLVPGAEGVPFPFDGRLVVEYYSGV